MNTGKQVQEFYNKIPFPDYNLDKFYNKESLKAAMYPFVKILDRSIPETLSIIDVGCGTGQLISYLSLRRKKVYGIDFSETSLNKARQLKKKLKLNSLTLKKVDVTDEEQINKLGKFDYVLCLGVLHHTADAKESFENVIKLLKPGGKIAIGLYNKIGRVPLKARKLMSRTIFKNNQRVKDYFIKMQIGDTEDTERARGWWHDQYQHVHETSHTVGQVLKWFKLNNIKYIQSVPSLNPLNEDILEIAGVWNDYKETYPCFLLRFYKQLMWLYLTQREGGYFIIFGESSLNTDKESK